MTNTITNEIKKAQIGDKDAMAKLVENNQGLIWSIVKRFTGRGYDIEDIYQIGAMGFIKSIRNFDINFDVKLSTYAVPYILGEIKRFLRDDGPIKVSRSLKDLNRKILEIQKEDIILAIESGSLVTSIEENIFSDNKEDSKINILETLSTNKDEESLITNKITITKIINELDLRDKEIIMLRYFRDKTQTDVARILGISQVQVSRIEKRILNKIKEELA